MSDTTEKVLLSVRLDYGDAVRGLTELATEMNTVKAKLGELKKAGQENTDEYQEQAQVLKLLTAQYNQNTKALQDSIKFQTAASGSIEEQRKELSILTAEYIKLSKVERESAGGKEMLQKIRSTSDSLKGLEKAMGDNRRNVGLYESAFAGLTEKFQIGGVSLGNVVSGFKGTKDALKSATEQTSMFNNVLKASVIGLVLVVVSALVAAFAKFQPLVDKVGQAFAAVNAVVDVFVERLIRVGKGIVAILSGDFEKGINEIGNAFTGMGDAMYDAANAAVELEKRMQDLEDAQRGLNVETAKQNAQIDQLLLKAKNRTLSEKERLALLDEASKKEKSIFEQNKKLAEEDLEIATQKALMKGQLTREELDQLVAGTLAYETEYAKRGTITDADLDKIAEAQAKIFNMEGESISLQEKITNRRDALRDAEQQKRDAANKKAIEDAKKLQDEFNKIISDADKKAEEDTKTFFDNLRKKRDQQNQEVEDEYNKNLTGLTDQLTQKLITQQEYNTQALLLESKRLEQEKQLADERMQSTTEIELQIAQNKLAIQQDSVENKKKLDEAEIKSSMAVAKSAQDLLNAFASAVAEGKDLQKAIALTNVAINLGTAIGNLVATTTAPSPDNIITGGIAGFVKYAAFLGQVLSSIGQARKIIGGAAAGGGDFMTKGPTYLLVGDNPGGVEHVSVTPISGKGQTRVAPGGNLVAMAGGGTLTTYGGYADRNGDGLSIQQLMDALTKLPNPIVNITELNKVNARIGRTVESSELK